jgi:hypothetical protein
VKLGRDPRLERTTALLAGTRTSTQRSASRRRYCRSKRHAVLDCSAIRRFLSYPGHLALQDPSAASVGQPLKRLHRRHRSTPDPTSLSARRLLRFPAGQCAGSLHSEIPRANTRCCVRSDRPRWSHTADISRNYRTGKGYLAGVANLKTKADNQSIGDTVKGRLSQTPMR